MLTNSGDAQAAGDTGSVEHAASRLNALLAGGGDSGANAAADQGKRPEPAGADTATQSEEAEAPADPNNAQVEGQSDEGEAADEGATQQPQKFRVKVDGEEVEVTLDELRKGYSLEKDATQKTMRAAEQRKAAEAAQLSFANARNEYAGYLDAIKAELSKPLYDAAEMETLRTGTSEQRSEYAARVAEEQQRRNHLENVAAQQRRISDEQARESQQATLARVQEETAKLIKAVPEWSDKAKREAGMKEVWDYGQALGFTPEELNGTHDHRAILVLREAAAYRKLQEKKVEVARKVEEVKTVSPGPAPKQTAQAAQFKQTRERFAKSGHVDDLAALLKKSPHLIS